MTTRHTTPRDDFDPDKLKDLLSARLGRKIELLTSPGEVIVEDEAGNRLDLDAKVVAKAIADAPGLAKTPEQRFLATFDAATTVDQKLSAVRDYIASLDAQRELVTANAARLRDQIAAEITGPRGVA